jgi:hypothetical protein
MVKYLRKITKMRKTAFEPCLPTRGSKVPSGPDWIHEIKHDGYRPIVQRDGELHDAVMTLTPEERRDRLLANQVVREGPGPLRRAASADQHGVPMAEE